MHDFPDVASWLLNAGGAIQAADEGDLYEACHRLLSDPEAAKTIGERARSVVIEHQGATEKVLHEVVGLLGGR
jgi:3-deoxy-D-manno-octulosonic-acid transferase